MEPLPSPRSQFCEESWVRQSRVLLIHRERVKDRSRENNEKQVYGSECAGEGGDFGAHVCGPE